MEQFVACPQCGATNRLKEGKTGAACGRCKATLPAEGHVETISDANFQAFTETARLPVLVDFWAPWCGPCQMVGPIVEQMAKKHFGKVRVGKLNTDENPATSARFNIRSIPTIMLFKDGQVVDQIAGAMPAPQFDQWLSRHL